MKPVSALALLYCFPLLAAAALPTTLPTAPKGFDVASEGIEHGKLIELQYPSNSTGKLRPAVIYTPPGYSQNHRYPVLYLLHGAGTDQTGWERGGHVKPILDNLISTRKCLPMIVVMPCGFAVSPGQ